MSTAVKDTMLSYQLAMAGNSVLGASAADD
jgi:hypothetical protein